MSTPAVKFNKHDRPEFFRVLRSRVNKHFKENKISRYANAAMLFKTVFMVSLYVVPLSFLLTGVVSSFWAVTLTWLTMGLGMAGIGLCVMHDANHGSYSSNQYINRGIGYIVNLVGGYHVNWVIQHNVLHHSFTNIHDHDEDLDKGVLRFSPNQERKGFFRYQAFYAPFLYGLMTIYWLLAKDFQLLFRYDRKNLLEAQGLTFYKALFFILFNKTWYVILTIVMPLLIIDLPVGQILFGFFMMHFICGLILALIFQPAHIIEETDFHMTDEDGNVENNWAIHQLHSTANFANGNYIFSWFVGGLNYQIEHHLFPNMCHIHYRSISKIVKATAAEFDIPYHHHKTFYGAVKSHFSLLHQLGTGQYDQNLALELEFSEKQAVVS